MSKIQTSDNQTSGYEGNNLLSSHVLKNEPNGSNYSNHLLYKLEQTLDKAPLNSVEKSVIQNTLFDLHTKHQETFEHSIRVALCCQRISDFLKLGTSTLFLAGLLHDVGKLKIDQNLLNKKDNWTVEDKEQIKPHVLAGYELIVDTFELPATIILYHHMFQPDPYPKISELPDTIFDGSLLHMKILHFGKLLSIADCYDALHRKNSCCKELNCSDENAIRDKLISQNIELKTLIQTLFEAGVLNN